MLPNGSISNLRHSHIKETHLVNWYQLVSKWDQDPKCHEVSRELVTLLSDQLRAVETN